MHGIACGCFQDQAAGCSRHGSCPNTGCFSELDARGVLHCKSRRSFGTCFAHAFVLYAKFMVRCCSRSPAFIPVPLPGADPNPGEDQPEAPSSKKPRHDDPLQPAEATTAAAARPGIAIDAAGLDEGLSEGVDVPLRPQEKKKLDFRGKLYLAPLTTVGNLPFRSEQLCFDALSLYAVQMLIVPLLCASLSLGCLQLLCACKVLTAAEFWQGCTCNECMSARIVEATCCSYWTVMRSAFALCRALHWLMAQVQTQATCGCMRGLVSNLVLNIKSDDSSVLACKNAHLQQHSQLFVKACPGSVQQHLKKCW